MKTLFLLQLIIIGVLCPLFSQNPDSKLTSTFTDSRDGHIYRWIKIGTQIWMAENLDYLPSVSYSSEGSSTVKHYYVYDYEGSSVSEAKTKLNYTTYGVLYNWEVAKTACPSGWHLPSDAEWKTLEKHLGMRSSKAKEYGFRISGAVGKKLKSTSGWFDKGNGDNSSGFRALPGGNRDYNKEFNSLGYSAIFWSASERDASNAWGRILNSIFDGVGRGSTHKSYGYSVRCLQN